MAFLAILLSPYLLWLLYLAVMALDQAKRKDKLTKTAERLAQPIVWAGYGLDVALNVTLFSALVLDVPREWTITSHVNRLLETGLPTGGLGYWQQLVCGFLCTHLLNPFDPSGTHCKARSLP